MTKLSGQAKGQVNAELVIEEEAGLERFIPPTLFLIVVLGAWEVLVHTLDVPPWLLPAPSRIFKRFLDADTLWYHTSQTLLEALLGFSASAIIGISLSGAIAHFQFLKRGLYPYIVVSNSIPIIAIIPLLTIWFGFGIAPKIMIASIITFFPIVTNTTQGLRSADPRLLDFMHSINATR